MRLMSDALADRGARAAGSEGGGAAAAREAAADGGAQPPPPAQAQPRAQPRRPARHRCSAPAAAADR